jgi:hypothetical protein
VNDVTDTAIKYGEGWNCCKDRPAAVIVFDNGARWAVCKGCASAYTGEVQELPKELIDATKYVDEIIPLLRVEVKTLSAAGKGMRELAEKHGRTTVAYLFDAQPLADAPKNAKERRQHAIAVLLMVHQFDSSPERTIDALETMRKLGRTERWQGSITNFQNALATSDFDWALMQFSTYLNYAA